MKKRKTLLIWASVINFIAAAFFVYSAVLLINNVDGFADELKVILQTMYTEEMVVSYLNFCGTYFIMAAVCDALCGGVYIWLALVKEKLFFKLKIFLTIAAIINIFIGMNIISLVFVLIVIFTVKPDMNNNSVENAYASQQSNEHHMTLTSSSEELREQLKIRNMAEKIELIKHLKQEGSISETEYNKLLDEIISSGVQE